jgi:ATP-binding cassette subfamily B protein
VTKLILLLRRTWELSRGYRHSFVLGGLGLLAVDLLDLLPPMALALLIDSVAKKSPALSPLVIAGGYIGIFVLQSIFRFPMRLGFMGASIKVAGTVREKYGLHLLALPKTALERYSRGDLLSRATNDLDTIERGLGAGCLFLIDSVYYLLVIPPVLCAMSPALVLYAFIPLPLAAFTAWLLIARIGQTTERLLQSFGCMNAKILENASLSHTVRAFGMEETEIARFREEASEVMANSLRLVRLEASLASGLQILLSLGVLALLLFGGGEVQKGKLSTGQFVAFLQYMGMMAWPIMGMAWGLVLLKKGGASLERLDEILGIPPVACEEEVNQEPQSLPGGIEVRGLTFSREGTRDPVLKDISFRIRPGERVAMVGPIGSGKSTLLDLLIRYLEPPRGTIFLCGRDVRQMSLKDLRREIAMVPQETFLFPESIRENIRLGCKPGTDEPSVERAAGLALVLQDTYPEGLETRVSVDRTGLSGGQRQRVALARALMRDPSILILDDTSSALDLATERAVFESLGRLPAATSLLFVTHRAYRLPWADRILVLDQGRLVEEGSHLELMTRNGLYAALVGSEPLEETLDRS